MLKFVLNCSEDSLTLHSLSLLAVPLTNKQEKNGTEYLEAFLPGSLLYRLKGNERQLRSLKEARLEGTNPLLMIKVLWGVFSTFRANLSPEVLPEPSNLFDFTKFHFLSIHKSPYSQFYAQHDALWLH